RRASVCKCPCPRRSRHQEGPDAGRGREGVRSAGSAQKRRRDHGPRLQDRTGGATLTRGLRIQLEDPSGMKGRVFVTVKKSVFDPQGKTIADALHSMGYNGIGDVRQGKFFALELDAPSALRGREL